MWLPMLSDDSESALAFATESVDRTYNRMRDTKKNRLFRIYVGKVAENIVHRYLVDELELKLEVPPRSVSGPDQFDFTLDLRDGNVQSGDVKSFHIYATWQGNTRTPEQIEQESWALVPMDQFRNQPKDLYVFAMLLGDRTTNTDGIECLSDDSGITLVRWATNSDVSDWEEIPRGSTPFPYSRTRTRNYGQLMSECRDIERLAAL